jgi:hypothetical protein
LLGAITCRRNRRYRPVGCTAPIVALLHHCRRSSTSTRRALLVILLAIINFFSSFNNVDPSHMMLVDCCVLFSRGCGPIAANSAKPISNHMPRQPPIPPNISTNIWWMRTFEVALHCACIVSRQRCHMVAHIYCHGVGVSW